ncbi:YoaK family protein [Corynebacterium sp. A21]|uniref:YoaK family protein n=1 Tax=Corynebacterium sp. A21 TaxID=3457318 RepID=UPI003FD68E37
MTTAQKIADTPTIAGKGESYVVWLMMILTFVTGLVDAVGYLGLDRVFVGNMTGNIVILGMGAAGANELPIIGPLGALISFSLAAAIAGLVLKSQGSAWTTRITSLLGIGGATLVILTVVLVIAGPELSPIVQIVVACATAAVMGVQAYVARKLAVKDMTTVVVTSTLTQLSGDLFSNGWRGLWNRRFAAITVLFAGAVVGALLLTYTHMSWALGISAALTLIVAAQGHRHLRNRECY